MKSLLLLIFLGCQLACSVFAAGLPQVEHLDGAEYSGVLARVGRVFIAGQPSGKGIEDLAGQGVRAVVNLRTPAEMKSLDFDEADEAKKLGIDYVALPSGGPDFPFTPETLARFASVMDHSDGDVLLHCKSATRASHLWVAYLVKYRNVPLADALAQGRAISFGASPIEGFLKGEIEYSFTNSSP